MEISWADVWYLFHWAILSSLLAGVVCPLVGTFLLVRRTGFYGVALPQFAAAQPPAAGEPYELPEVDLDEVRRADEQRLATGRVAHYALPLAVDVDPWREDHGVWDRPSEQQARWRLHLVSRDALSRSVEGASARVRRALLRLHAEPKNVQAVSDLIVSSLQPFCCFPTDSLG